MESRKECMRHRLFIKFGQKEHLLSLQKGTLYTKKIKYFIEYEEVTGEQGIGDKSEASLLSISKHRLFIQVDDDPLIEIDAGNPPGIIYDENYLSKPVFCLMHKDVDLYIEDGGKEVIKLGSLAYEAKDFLKTDIEIGALIILLPNLFLERLESYAKDKSLGIEHGIVTYRCKKEPRIENGEWCLDTPFVKDIAFKHQSEYRIIFHENIESWKEYDIGNLEDISIYVQQELFDSKMRIEIKPTET